MSNQVNPKTENNNFDSKYLPRQQNRRVAIAMWPETLPDGHTTRVNQVLDALIPFEYYPELLKTMNSFREENYGEIGKLFETKNKEIPNNPELTVHIITVNSKTGKIVNHKAFIGPEAREYMAKKRQEIVDRKERTRELIERQIKEEEPKKEPPVKKNVENKNSNNNKPKEFGTSLQSALLDAQRNKQVAAV